MEHDFESETGEAEGEENIVEEEEEENQEGGPRRMSGRVEDNTADQSHRPGRYKRPRHCVYCLKCNYLHDKASVQQYTKHYNHVHSPVQHTYRGRKGRDPFLPMTEGDCEVGRDSMYH